jgi:hypothetical protein
MQNTLLVWAEWDDEGRVWVATSNDVAGLATEADTIEALCNKLKIMVPELLSANGYLDPDNIRYELVMCRPPVANTSHWLMSSKTRATPKHF